MTGMEKAVQAIFAFAESVEAFWGESEWSFRAFIEPESTESPEEEEIMPAGIYDGRRYSLIAEPTAFCGTEKGAEITAKSGCFELIRLEKMPTGHWEGILKRKAGDD